MLMHLDHNLYPAPVYRDAIDHVLPLVPFGIRLSLYNPTTQERAFHILSSNDLPI